MQNKKINKSKKDNSPQPLSKIFIGSVISCLMFVGLIAVFAAFSLKNGVESESYKIAGLVISVISGVIGGFFAVKPLKEKGAIYGAISGIVSSVIIGIILFSLNKASAGSTLFLSMGLVLIGSIIGGITAVNLKIKKKY